MEYEFQTVMPTENYTYEMMIRDLGALERKYGDHLSIASIGKSEEGRELVLAKAGARSARWSIFISASIHAREHMTSLIACSQIEYLLSCRTIPEDVRFIFLPMANPDGVYISQTGILPKEFESVYTLSDAKRWKANARGIDLNSNFDGNWTAQKSDVTRPSPWGFKGYYPECAAESRAIAEYLRQNPPNVTLSYHTTGSEIYYRFGTNPINEKCLSLATAIADLTRFKLCLQSPDSAGGLKDWAIDKLSVPSLTIEFGHKRAPHALCEFHDMWKCARDIPLTAAKWLLDEKSANN